MATPAPRSTITGLVLATTASRNRNNPRRQMCVLTDDDRELCGTIPASLRLAATTLSGRRIQFSAVVNHATGQFSYPADGTVLAPDHLAHSSLRAGSGRRSGCRQEQ